MKKLTLTFALLFTGFYSFGQTGGYQTAMATAIQNLNTAKTPEALQAAANQFDRIGNTEKKEWLPGYYAAFAAIQISFMEKEPAKRDMYLDKAQQYLDQAIKLVPQESEVYVMQAILHQSRIQVSPMERGQKYFMLAEEALGQAKTLNPGNPRSFYVSGQGKFYMPAAFGGGPQAALPLLTTAQQKFETFKPASDLAPNWGLASNQNLLQKCQAAINAPGSK